MHKDVVESVGFVSASVALLLQAICAFLLWSRKLKNEYPFFFRYLVFQVITSIPLFFMYRGLIGNTTSFFYAYWVQSALADTFGFVVLYELFCAAFKPFPGLKDLGQVVFRWAALALLLVGLSVFFASSLPRMTKISLAITNIERSIYVMQIGLLLFLYMGSSYLGLSKRSHVFGISLGFAIFAGINLIYVSILSIFGIPKTHLEQMINFLPSISCNLVLIIWAYYLLQPEPSRETINVPVTSPLLRWNEAAMALGHSGGRVAFIENPEPFMPSVERMVEEVMKKDLSARRT